MTLSDHFQELMTHLDWSTNWFQKATHSPKVIFFRGFCDIPVNGIKVLYW